ncbi:hypothetical protein VOLCADRAFT_101506, partial [Volvox carteri f. nagariensis]
LGLPSVLSTVPDLPTPPSSSCYSPSRDNSRNPLTSQQLPSNLSVFTATTGALSALLLQQHATPTTGQAVAADATAANAAAAAAAALAAATTSSSSAADHAGGGGAGSAGRAGSCESTNHHNHHIHNTFAPLERRLAASPLSPVPVTRGLMSSSAAAAAVASGGGIASEAFGAPGPL